MILLDTNALLWMHQGHRRTRALGERRARLYLSPASLLEVQLLLEVVRIRLRGRGAVGDLVHDSRWLVDDPPATVWFQRALEIGWTRDPFDRLLVAHALHRGWRLATADTELVARLGERAVEL